MPAPAKNQDLHGNVPDMSPVALVLIDVINDLDFPGGDRLVPHARSMARHLARLKARAREAGVPVIYANDNFGRWRSDLAAQVKHCLEDDVPGREVVRQLLPDQQDYVVLKPKHSAFYATTLDVLLDYLGARTLVLAGIAGDSCVLFTANDAFLRDFELIVARDCVVSQDPEENERALALMERVLKARLEKGDEIDFAAIGGDHARTHRSAMGR